MSQVNRVDGSKGCFGTDLGTSYAYLKGINLCSPPLSIVSRRVGSPLPVGENLDSPLNFHPPGSSKTKSSPQEAFVISVPTNCQVRLLLYYQVKIPLHISY